MDMLLWGLVVLNRWLAHFTSAVNVLLTLAFYRVIKGSRACFVAFLLLAVTCSFHVQLPSMRAWVDRLAVLLNILAWPVSCRVTRLHVSVSPLG